MELIDEVRAARRARASCSRTCTRAGTRSCSPPRPSPTRSTTTSTCSTRASWPTAGPTSGDVEKTKPEPDLVAAAVEKAGGGPAVMLGDSTWDCKAAERAGVPTIGVLTGGFCEQELREAGAVCVVSELRTLLDDAGRDAARRRRSADRTVTPRSTTEPPTALLQILGDRPVVTPDAEPTSSAAERPPGRRLGAAPRTATSRAQEDRRLLIRYHRHGDQAGARGARRSACFRSRAGWRAATGARTSRSTTSSRSPRSA